MRTTGKIPEGTGLTVEHIIDREHGGTNHAHNFILMSGEINALQDKFKRSQVPYLPDKKMEAVFCLGLQRGRAMVHILVSL
jgi:hypothetical protein